MTIPIARWTGLTDPATLPPDDLDALVAATPTDLAPVHAPGDDGIERVAITDDDEPLVRVDGVVGATPAYARRGLAGATGATWVRAGVCRRLEVADAALPAGFGLHVLDGWRDPVTQRALFDEVYGPGSTLPPGFVADPDDTLVPPPHTTGAAVDLTLAWHGTPLALGTDFDSFEPPAHLAAFEHPDADPLVRHLRRLLHAVLRHADFTGLVEEWWHVSHGDQRWALHRATTARYGPTSPDREGPLEP